MACPLSTADVGPPQTPRSRVCQISLHEAFLELAERFEEVIRLEEPTENQTHAERLDSPLRYIQLDTYVHIDMYVYLSTYTYIYICIYIYIYVYTCTYMYVHMHMIYIYICICVFTYIYIYVSTHTTAYKHVQTHTYTYTYTFTSEGGRDGCTSGM